MPLGQFQIENETKVFGDQRQKNLVRDYISQFSFLTRATGKKMQEKTFLSYILYVSKESSYS